LTIVPTDVPDSDHKLFIGGFAHHINSLTLLEILKPFGKVAKLNMVREAGNMIKNKGYAFFEYATGSVNPNDGENSTESCIRHLNGVVTTTGGPSLTVKWASSSR